MSTRLDREGIVTASIVAAPIEQTGNVGDGTHQLRMGGDRLFIHITPECAKQWAEVLADVAKEATPNG